MREVRRSRSVLPASQVSARQGLPRRTSIEADHARARRIRVLSAAAFGGGLSLCSFAAAVPALTHRYSFNDGTVNDSIGGANGQLVVNNVAVAPGTNVAGGVLTLYNTGTSAAVATGQYLDLPNQIIADTSNFTVEGWTTWGGGNVWQRIFDFGTGTSGEIAPGSTAAGYNGTAYDFVSPQTGRNGNVFGSEQRDGTNSDVADWVGGTSIGTGAEHSFAFSINASTMSLYRDGVLVARTLNATHYVPQASLLNDWIGRSQYSGDSFYNGSIDEFRIYNGGITSAQAALNNALGPNLTATANLWTGAGSSNYDVAGNWSNNNVPATGTADLAILGNGGNPIVSDTPPVAAQLQIANGTLTVTNGGNLTIAGGIDFAPGSTGTASVQIVNGGVLSLGGAFVDGEVTTALTGAKSITLDGGTLRAVNTLAIPGAVAININAGGATFDTNGNSMTLGALSNGTTSGGALTKIGAGTLFLTASSNGFTGPVNVNAGTINFVASSLGTGSALNFNGGTLQYAAGNVQDVTAGRTVTFNAAGGGVDTGTNNVIFNNPINGTGTLTKAGAGVLFLTANNAPTFTGALNLVGGLINFANTNNLGGGNTLTFNGGGLQWAGGNTLDITNPAVNGGRTLAAGAGGAIIDTTNNNVTFANAFPTTTGPFIKRGTGSLTVKAVNASNLFINQGTVVVPAGATLTTTSYSSIGQVNGDNGTLDISGTVTINGDFNISDVATSTGSMFIRPGATVKGINLFVGKSGASSGAVSQTGGSFGPISGTGDWRVGGAGGTGDAAAVGSYDVLGGTFSTANNFQIGAFGRGIMTINGGSATATAGYPVVGRFVGGVGVLTVANGSFTQGNTGNILLIGEAGNGTANILGGGTLAAVSPVTLGGFNGNPGTGSVNLVTGGTFSAPQIVHAANAGSLGTLNFHGGTLAAPAATTAAQGAAYLQGLTNAYVWSEGGTINTGTNTLTIAQGLQAPTGIGVGNIPLSTGGTGYVSTPMVLITGGGGTGAAAVANLTNGVVTSITLTNPGVGYTSAPTVTLVGGNPATPASIGGASLNAGNTSGGLTKSGTGVLNLTGASTYTGTTTVSAGTLRLNGSLSGSVSVASGGTLGGTGTANAPVTITSGGTLAPGNSVGTLNTGNLALNNGSNYSVELDPTNSAGNGTADQTNVIGTVGLGGGALTLTLLSAPTNGQQFTIINNDAADPVAGTFAGLPQGSTVSGTFAGTAYNFTVNYAGGDGNDVVLTNAVPEPASLSVIGVGGTFLLARRRRSRKA